MLPVTTHTEAICVRARAASQERATVAMTSMNAWQWTAARKTPFVVIRREVSAARARTDTTAQTATMLTSVAATTVDADRTPRASIPTGDSFANVTTTIDESAARVVSTLTSVPYVFTIVRRSKSASTNRGGMNALARQQSQAKVFESSVYFPWYSKTCERWPPHGARKGGR